MRTLIHAGFYAFGGAAWTFLALHIQEHFFWPENLTPRQKQRLEIAEWWITLMGSDCRCACFRLFKLGHYRLFSGGGFHDFDFFRRQAISGFQHVLNRQSIELRHAAFSKSFRETSVLR